jgi:uncharacterized protein YuzE
VDTLAHVWVDYDQEADIFYVRLRSDIQDARTDEAGHGVLIDRDPATGEVLGIEILDFLGHFAACREISWLGSYGISDEILRFLRQKAHEFQQSACSPESLSPSSE